MPSLQAQVGEIISSPVFKHGYRDPNHPNLVFVGNLSDIGDVKDRVTSVLDEGRVNSRYVVVSAKWHPEPSFITGADDPPASWQVTAMRLVDQVYFDPHGERIAFHQRVTAPVSFRVIAVRVHDTMPLEIHSGRITRANLVDIPRDAQVTV